MSNATKLVSPEAKEGRPIADLPSLCYSITGEL